MKRTPAILSVLLWFLLAQPILADRILLRNGQTIEGTIINQSRQQVVVRSAAGVKRIPKSQIRRIRYGKTEPESRRPVIAKKEPEQKRESKKSNAAQKKADPEPKPVVERPLDRTGVVWRSAVLPGWGHYAMKERTTGMLYGGAFLGSLIATLYYRDAALRYENKYHSTATDSSGSMGALSLYGPNVGSLDGGSTAAIWFAIRDGANKERYQQAIRRYHYSLAVLGGLYVSSLVHAFISGSSLAELKKAALGSHERPTFFGFVQPHDGAGPGAHVTLGFSFSL